MIHGDSGAFYSLTNVGLEIWEKIEEPKRLADVVRDLTESYDVEPEECEVAVHSFANELVRVGLAEYI